MSEIAAFHGGRWTGSLDTEPVPGTGLRLSLVPEIVLRDLARRSAPAGPSPSAAQRREVVRRAVALFGTGDVEVGPLGTQSADRFRDDVGALLGLPEVLVRSWEALLRGDVDRLLAEDPARPVGGSTLVWLPGNTFTCLVAVCEAVLGADVVLVRPSRHEPLSAARFTACLLAAGWPADRIRFCPTAPGLLRRLARLTDHQIVYGGPSVARVLPPAPGLDLRGPGRGCAVVGPDALEVGVDAVVERLADLVAGQSGRFCTAVRTVLCAPGTPPEVGERLAATLDGVTLPAVDPRRPVGWHPAGRADGLARAVRAGLRGDDVVRTGRDLLTTGGGRTWLAPTLVRVADPVGHPLVGWEPPFPFAAEVRAPPARFPALTARARYVYSGPGLEVQERTPTP